MSSISPAPNVPNLPTLTICPRCADETLVEGSRELSGRVCTSCRGHFLPMEGVRKLVVEHLGVSEELLAELPSFSAGKALICPACRARTQPCTLKGVPVDRCSGCGGLWLDRGEFEALAKDAFSATASPTPKPSARPSGEGWRKRQRQPHTSAPIRVDSTTALEHTVSFFMFFAGLCVAGGGIGVGEAVYNGSASEATASIITLVVSAVALALLFGIRVNIDCSHFLDMERRVLIYSRSIFGFDQQRDVCRFTDIKAITTAGYRRRSNSGASSGPPWTYTVTLVLNNGKTQKVSDSVAEHSESVEEAEKLAKTMDVPHIKGHPKRELEVKFINGHLIIR